jgi:hypothetical protein
MPFETLVPSFLISSVRKIAESDDLNLEYAEFGFDSDTILKGVQAAVEGAKNKNQALYKAIDSKFTVADPELDPVAFAIIVDENAINKYIVKMVQIERKFSLRSFILGSKKFPQFAGQLHTTNIGKIMPSFLDEFGPNRFVDIVGSMSQKAINSQVEEEVNTGFTLDKNGNFKFQLNFYMEVLVEVKGPPRSWDKARTAVVGVTFKGKF